MRIAVEHRSHYSFSEPQARIVQMLRLTPCDTLDQTVVSWMVGVDCDARLREAVDGFGNAVTMLYAEGPIETLDISVTGEVLTNDAAGIVRDSAEPLPPMLYLRDTPRTQTNDAIRVFAADAAAPSNDMLERLHRLNAALHGRYPRMIDLPDTGSTAVAAFEHRPRTSRDLAQIFIAGARSLGAPARYISGYLGDGVSHCAPHGWAEAFVEGLGWVGFDATTGLSPDQRYVRVAVGLDASGAAAIAGTRVGQGEEALAIDLSVEQLGGEE